MNNIDRAIVLDEAKAYSDRKGGYVESGKVLADIDLKTGNGFEKFADMPEIGRTYTIVLDSGTYSAKCKEIEGIEGVGYCGNLSILGDAIEGAVDTGESFLIFVVHNDAGDGMTSYTVIDKNEGAHCTVSTAETIHPIDPKFLPGVCLPVVEITSAAYPESGTVELSAEESVKLDAAVAEGFPVVVKMTIFGMPAAVVCTCLGGKMLNGFIVESSIGFAKDDTVWKMGEV